MRGGGTALEATYKSMNPKKTNVISVNFYNACGRHILTKVIKIIFFAAGAGLYYYHIVFF